MTLDEFLLAIYGFFLNQEDRMFDTNIYLGLAGRLIYILSFLSYYHLKLKRDNIEIFSKKFNQKFWIFFLIKEIVYIFCAIPIDFIAVFILGYSILQSSQLLTSKTEEKHYFMNFIGYLLSPVIFILGVIGFFILANGDQDLIFDGIALVISGLSFLIMRRGFPKSQTIDNYSNFEIRSTWGQIPNLAKVIGILFIILTPLSLAILIDQRIIPDSKVYMIPMEDGVKLKTKVIYPFDWNGEPKPVILSRTPYNLENLAGYWNEYTLQKGYITVVQDIRGTYGSEGKNYGFFTEYSDGNVTVNWILNQTWCNGKIASIGGSALGINQLVYQPSKPNGLKAASILVGAGELYDYVFMIGGCIRQGVAENWLTQVFEPDSIEVLLNHVNKDDYWENVSLEMNNRVDGVNVRALHAGGWYDMFCQGTIDGFMKYNEYGSDYAKNHQILVMGPWSHGLSNEHEDITYPNPDNLDYLWKNREMIIGEYLEGNTIDWDNYPRVFYYVMGDPEGDESTIEYNHWRNSSIWPLDTTDEKWYLHPNGELSPIIPSISSNRSFIYDPRNPVPNGGGSTLTLAHIGAVDQRKFEYTKPLGTINRTDILKFDSKILSSSIEVIGNLQAELYISSNCTDTDFTAKLIDVFPDGREMWIADGILKARYREGFESQQLMIPGNLYELDINLWSTAYRFVEGHKIRLSISSSNWNKFAVNPNTGAPINNTHPSDLVNGVEDYYIANNSVVCGLSGYLSCIHFPRSNL